MTSEVSSILMEMGWDKTHSLPTANSTNAGLEIEISEKVVEIEKGRLQIENYKIRNKNLKETLINVRIEFAQTQQLIKARQKEMEAEDHMFQLAYREDEWLANDIEKLQKRLVDLDEKCQRQKTLIARQQDSLRLVNEELKIDEKSLLAWLDEISSHDDNVSALQQYSKQDEQKMKELVKEIRGLADSLEDEKGKLSELVTEYRCCQMEMNKTAEEYTQIHEVRHGLIKQWEGAVEQLQDRDREITGVLNDMNQVRGELLEKKEIEKVKVRFLNELKRDNREIMFAMRIGDRKLTKLKENSRAAKTQLELQADDLRTIISQIKRCGGEILGLREEIKHWEQLNIKTKEKHEEHVLRIDELRITLVNVKGDLLTSDQKANVTFKYFQCMETRQKNLEFELHRMMEVRYLKLQELETGKDCEKTVSSEIQGCRTSTQNLKKRLGSLEKMAQRQDEVIYGQDVVIQQLEDRISRITGNTRAEEKRALENKVAKLEDTLEKKETSCNFLNQQIKYLEEDVWRVKRALMKQKEVQQDLNVKMKDLGMEIDTATLELKSLMDKKQNLIVEENILNLHVKKLKDDLTNKVGSAVSLGKQKIEMEKMMREHRNSIDTQHEMLRSQYFSIEDERHYLNSELNNHKAVITKLKNRYEVLVTGMSDCVGVPDDDITCHVTYFIKHILEKQRLQLEGDQMEKQVINAEREITALENTLKLMNSSNDSLRKSFTPVTKTSEEHEEKLQLEDQLRLSKEKQVIKKKERNELLNYIEQLTKACAMIDIERNRLNYNCRELKDHLCNLGRRMQEQYAKLDRASSLNTKYTKSIRPKEKPRIKILTEYDFDLRILRDANKFLVKSFENFMTDKPSLREQAAELFDEANLPPLKTTTEPEEVSSLSVLSNASFCSSHGEIPSDGAVSGVVNITFPESVALNDINKIKLTRTAMGVRRCGSEVVQTARASRVMDARKAPKSELSVRRRLKPGKSACSVTSAPQEDDFTFL